MSDSCNSATSSSCNAQHVVALWHNRLGHPNRMGLNKELTRLNLHSLSHTTPLFCDACQSGKLHQHSFPLSYQHTTKPFQIVHSDVWGPSPHLSLDGNKYYVSFVDDFTRYTWIFPLRLKSEVPSMFLYFNTMVKKQFDTHIQCLQSDWGSEYRKLQSVLNELGIVFRHPCSHTHQQEGRAERKHRSIVEIGFTLLAQASMDLLFWWEAFVSATYLLNRLPTSVLHHFSPFGSLFGYPPDYKFLNFWVCLFSVPAAL